MKADLWLPIKDHRGDKILKGLTPRRKTLVNVGSPAADFVERVETFVRCWACSWSRSSHSTQDPIPIWRSTNQLPDACKCIRTHNPPSGRLLAVTVPPQDSTHVLTMVMPNPTPPVSRVREASTR